MESSQDPNLKHPVTADDEAQLDLYTIPSNSSWFSWDDIHETERLELKEFFDGSSITRTPKIYKEYRDFIISKYREDPSRRLTFTEVRKSLVGDLSLLHKVFSTLERWGLINFAFAAPSDDDFSVEEKVKVRVEEGAPHGVRVVAVPNSLKAVSLPPPIVPGAGGGYGDLSGFKLPSLASYTDVYGKLAQQQEQKNGLVCGNCKERCDTGHYECLKDGSFLICVKCYKNEKYGENKSVDDFKFIEGVANHGAIWTEAETLLLLESVLKHGDDWELVAQNVQTKSKLDCISKLMQLPFGELMMGSAHGKGKFWDTNVNNNNVKQIQLASTESQETMKADERCHELKNESQQNGDSTNEGPPLKRVCLPPNLDSSTSLMKQVANITTVVGPHITASASEAAVMALCHQNQCTREIFDCDEDVDELGSSPQNNEIERAPQLEHSEMEERPNDSAGTQETSSTKNNVLLSLRIKAATATALGAAAAHAKLLADQEDKEVEHLVSTIIETQMKKLQCKIKHFEDLELIMEKEHAQMEEMEVSLLAERMNVLQRVFSDGISRWRDRSVIKSPMATVL